MKHAFPVCGLMLCLFYGCSSGDGGERPCLTDTDCPDGKRCLSNRCTTVEPCAGVECIHPDGDAACYDLPAPCLQGACQYAPKIGARCDDRDGCTENDACQDTGLCRGQPKTCDAPPPDECLDPDHLRRYRSAGTCQGGECRYGFDDYLCEQGCRDGACLGCQPEWKDLSVCDCTPGPCLGCDGQKLQDDGCGNQRQAACSLPPTGCAEGEICHQGTCCRPSCQGRQCGTDGCGGSCGDCAGNETCQDGRCVGGCAGCSAGEACVLGACAPVALLLAAEGDAPSGYCPPGYALAGRWRTGPFAADGGMEGIDFHRYRVDAGWMWLCSADPQRVKTVAGVNDCGGAVGACAGAARGAWHVGAGCGAQTAVDGDGVALMAGWLRLCVAPGTEAFAEIAGNDCGAAGPGCGARRSVGAFHTSPAACGQGATGVGDSGASFETGWMNLCVDSARFPPVEASTLEGKTLAGYQGWFATPGDGSAWNAWVHWFRSQTPEAGNATFDLWPDLSEYDADELCPSAMSYPGGETAGLFSAYREKTVRRHFRWMAEYGIDGVFLQRFLHEALLPAPGAFRDQVARNVMAAAEAYQRVFAIEYDISGASEDMIPERLIDDWKHLVDDLGLTRSGRYLRHRGRPLVGIWGIGFSDRAGTAADIADLLDFFHNAPEERYRATVLGGVPEGWRTSSGSSRPGFADAYRLYDVINPWLVGRYADEAGVAAFDRDFIEPDLAECQRLGRDYLPVLFPGFSWANLTGDAGTFNLIPRRGGSFYWKQFYEFLGSGCRMLFLAMFDEVDEGTAILKAAASQADLPAQGRFLALDQDGVEVPNDWYLRLAGAGAKTLAGQLPRQPTLPLK
ncbi:MAG: hypothetical protein GYA21_05835 [Myxococcales bacterium]|nr:hypothetical protein [Myxococcales bacterium]